MNIKKLEQFVKQSDEDILLKKPFLYPKYGRMIKIEHIKWIKWEEFAQTMANWLSIYYVNCHGAALPGTLNEVKEFQANFRTTMIEKKSQKLFFKMAKLSKISVRFIKKNFDINDMVELFTIIYLVNILSVKFACKTVLGLLGIPGMTAR